ncbi:LAMI_0D11166g1_1 [Lachancea mirantina]|uniref:Derlin n=1 Tax=Lachancea mirantina TaxID=1230905 RepID=A0A1G4JET0_9SACH|nr:LAMI_0D11166g1_1 [Lachancea mirantina]
MSHNNSPMQMLQQIPPVTRALLFGIFALLVVTKIGIVPAYLVQFSWYHVFMKLQVWRMFTSCLLLPDQPMPALLEVYNIYAHSSELELMHFGRSHTYDYIFYLTFGVLSIVMSVVLLRINNPFDLSNAFDGFLTYTWSIDNRNVKVMFYGLFPIWAKYFPLIQLFITFLFDDPIQGRSKFFITLIGYSTGYLYSCLDTRTLGPLYGYLTRQPNGYGYLNFGQFRAPWWFAGACDLFFGNGLRSDRYKVNVPIRNASTYQGKGQRLGMKKRAVGIHDQTTEIQNEQRHDTGSSATWASGNSASGYFPGKGHRVGTRD